jgi:hypothetical protein
MEIPPIRQESTSSMNTEKMIPRSSTARQWVSKISTANQRRKGHLSNSLKTFKHHMKPSHGFNSVNGATSLLTLFVTHYNFLRPHMSLKYKTPIELPELEDIDTIQGKWTKILSIAA